MSRAITLYDPEDLSTGELTRHLCQKNHTVAEIPGGEPSYYSNNSNTPPPGKAAERVHPVPPDSVLNQFLVVAREISEAPDSFSIAPMLAVCAHLLTPATWWDFGGKKFVNLFQFVVGPPALKKSTSFRFATRIAQEILDHEHFHRGNASDSALFEKFERNPHRLQLQAEANTIITNWSHTHSGRELANRYLDLYDGESWEQAYKHQKGEDDQQSDRHIGCATLSVAFGGTYNCCRFGGVDARSGLRRRFGYYVADSVSRTIYWPREIDDELVERFGVAFGRLREVQGVFRLAPDSIETWKTIQDENREKIRGIDGVDEGSEARRNHLGEEPARILKLAAIFEACRWASSGDGDPLTVRPDTLDTAWRHQLACNDAAAELETIGQRSRIHNECESLLATIRGEYTQHRSWEFDGTWIVIRKGELTRRFAASSRSAMTSDHLHHTILPALIDRGEVRAEKRSNTTVYFIHLEPVADG